MRITCSGEMPLLHHYAEGIGTPFGTQGSQGFPFQPTQTATKVHSPHINASQRRLVPNKTGPSSRIARFGGSTVDERFTEAGTDATIDAIGYLPTKTLYAITVIKRLCSALPCRQGKLDSPSYRTRVPLLDIAAGSSGHRLIFNRIIGALF
ncbi:AAEL006759-PA [Aedes aegypti]|uniref:AAEL006759-PA n=1 Tax=Aedes aegypti TaxID=7159 RepID=Q174V5_AEDAE|nr:AAEL006759-PA [Aedes aegypti]